ncbi:MAG: hypothetical protein ACOCZ3_02440 [Bacillota bacterium]
MKARLIPVYFEKGRNQEFDRQLDKLHQLLDDIAVILEPVALGDRLPAGEAVVFPQLLGDAYREINKIKEIDLPILAITSEFGTVAMWDWEIVTFLRSRGLNTFAPFSPEITRTICKTLATIREMKTTRFLIYQDDPGEDGMQASIFKRFYWWEDEATRKIKDKFGIDIIYKSYRELGKRMEDISDSAARKELNKRDIPAEDVSESAFLSAIKLYMAVRDDIDQLGNIGGVGMNCLNESFYSDTTPCLAWNLLFEERGIMWVCEGDTLSLLTKYIVYNSLGIPVIMSNVYPFLLGMAGLKHEKISSFPEVDEPENHLLVVHCGYFGLTPQSFAEEWTFRPKVLEIVDENATMIDARMPEGSITMTKIHPDLDKMMVVEGELEGYVQYPGSDCRNGALIKVDDGYKLIDKFYSHHICFAQGKNSVELDIMARLMDIEVDRV